MLKILFVVEDLDIGGTEKALCRWLMYFNREKFEVSIISFKDGILKKEIEKAGIWVEIYTKCKAWDLDFLLKLIRKIKVMDPDIVHCRNGMRAIMYGGVATKLCGKPLITSIHGRTHYFKIDFNTRIWLWVIKLSDMVITVSESIKEEISRLARIDRNKIKVIYNGIEVEKEKTIKDIREEIGLSKRDFVIGTVGSLRKVKGHKYLIEAIPIILKYIPNAKLVLIGGGEEENNLRDLAKALNLDGRVEFLGYRKNAKEIIGAFDVFVLPSISEGLPNVLLEAAINKKPIIATKVGGVEEVVKNRHSALLIESENPSMIAEKVLEIKENKYMTGDMVSNAHRDVMNNFSLHKFVKVYEEVYEILLGEVK